MATTDNNVQYDKIFFNHFFHKLGLNFTEEQLQAVEQLVDAGLLQRDRLVELAIAKVGNIALDSTVGQDFVNGKDAKSVVLSMRNNHKEKGCWTASFKIVKIAGKNGDLLAVAYNKILNKFHFFKIPHHSYRHLTTVLEIVLERYEGIFAEPQWAGVPNVECKWWKYEVQTFEELCS